MKKKNIYFIATVVVILGIAAGVLFSGVLVMPTAASLAKATPVESYDVLEYQFQRELDILADYAKGSYTPEDPYVIQDPYQANPLSALILFETAEPAQVSVTVEGKNQYAMFSFKMDGFTSHHEVAVLGLYAGQENQVDLAVAYQNGNKETFRQYLQTEPLPYDFPNLDVQVSKPEKMEPGVDLMIACLDSNYTYLLGKVLFVLKNREHQYIFASNAGVNGNFSARFDLSQVAPGEYAIHAAGGVVEGMDALGKVKPGYNPTSYKIQVP